MASRGRSSGARSDEGMDVAALDIVAAAAAAPDAQSPDVQMYNKTHDEPSNVDKARLSDEGARDDSREKQTVHYGWRFWIVFPVLCITAFTASLEGTVVSTALPTINRDLNTGADYVWVVNVFFLTSAALQPLYGQFANCFGRKWVMMFAVALFVVGSAVAGAANDVGQLIAGRAIQGSGSGGLVMMLDLIVSDLVPVRQRASFMGITFAAVNVGTAIGPFIGGIIIETISWRWVFYINIPIGSFTIAVIFLCLHTTYRRDLVAQRLRQMDYIGNAILIASTISILFALTYGNVRYAWSSWHIVVPFVLGFVGFGIFIAFEASPLPRQPVVPMRLFAHRTSALVYLITFFWSMLSFWRLYFLSVYFQAVKASSPARAGVQVLPQLLTLFPAVAIGGAVVKKTGRYKLLHITGLMFLTLGQGLYILLSPSSSTAEWVIFQLITGFFANLLLPVMLPAIQAELPETDTAVSVAFWNFLRSFGIIWGVSIPAAIFSSRFDSLAHEISDTAIRNQLTGGHAYQYASKVFIDALVGDTRTQVIHVYAQALQRTWELALIFSGISLLASLAEREIHMRTTIDTEYGLKEQGNVQARQTSAISEEVEKSKSAHEDDS